MKLSEKIAYKRLMRSIFSEKKPIVRQGILRLQDKKKKKKKFALQKRNDYKKNHR